MALELEAARELLRARLQPLPSERRPLLHCLGLAPVVDLHADRALPPFDRVAMDGYAVRAADVVAATAQRPVELRVVAAAYAGQDGIGIGPGECARAMTGAPLPAGADAVVPVEWTTGYQDRLACFLRPVERGSHFAPRAEDCSAGSRILAAGTRLRPAHLQLLAATGHVELEVHRPPRAIVFATGDELVDPAQTPSPVQIRESNALTTQGLLAAAGIPCAHGGILRDQRAALREALADAFERYELIVLSGGVSKGERDHVLEILRELGATLHFTSLKLRPGHPASFASTERAAIFALPGNPVAVVATLCAVYAAGLERLLGIREPPVARYARLDFAHRRTGDRTQLLPVRLREVAHDLPAAESVRLHGSGDFFALAQADALALLPSDRSEFEAGDRVRLYPLQL